MVKDQDLLFLGDNYLFASWLNTSTNEMYYAIFRDLTEDNVTNFVISQLAGPWRDYDAETDSLVFNSEYDKVYLEQQKKAEIILDSLNKEKDIQWEGNTLVR